MPILDTFQSILKLIRNQCYQEAERVAVGVLWIHQAPASQRGYPCDMWVSRRTNNHCSTLPKVTFPARKKLEMLRMPAPHYVSTLANSNLCVTWELALERRPRRGSQHLRDWQSPGVRVVPLPQSLCVPPLNLLPPRNHNACSARPCSASRPENSLCIFWLLAPGQGLKWPSDVTGKGSLAVPSSELSIWKVLWPPSLSFLIWQTLLDRDTQSRPKFIFPSLLLSLDNHRGRMRLAWSRMPGTKWGSLTTGPHQSCLPKS